MFEVGCRACRTRVKVPATSGVYKCKCQEVAVRVDESIALITEFTKGVSVLLKENPNKQQS